MLRYFCGMSNEYSIWNVLAAMTDEHVPRARKQIYARAQVSARAQVCQFDAHVVSDSNVRHETLSAPSKHMCAHTCQVITTRTNSSTFHPLRATLHCLYTTATILRSVEWALCQPDLMRFCRLISTSTRFLCLFIIQTIPGLTVLLLLAHTCFCPHAGRCAWSPGSGAR